MDNFEKEMLNKIDNNKELTKEELEGLVSAYEKDVEYGDIGRWTRSVNSIIDLCGRSFCINWEEGLTEYQDNEFYNQPYEVELKEYEKTIMVKEWIAVNKNNMVKECD